MSITVSLRVARSQDMAACAGIVNAWIDETPWLPRLHSPESVVNHYRAEFAENRRTLVAVVDSAIAGFATLSRDGFVTALHVDGKFRRRGIGSLLLTRSKTEIGGQVRLWTFQANQPALDFFTRHGFVETNRTSGDNDENLPDILLEWQS